MNFADLATTLNTLRVTDVFLPFLLIFVIIFAVLQKSNILGEGKRNFNVVVSAVVGLLVVIPHVTGNYPPGADVVRMINQAIPKVSLVIVAILMALLLIGILGGEAKWMGGSISGWIALLAFGIVVYIFGGEAGWWSNSFRAWGWWTSESASIIIIVLVFALVIWYITREPSKADQAGAFSNAFGKLGDMFKK